MILTMDNLEVAVAAVIDQEPRLESIVDQFGLPKPWWRTPGFATLILMILEQQISVDSARAAYDRLADKAGEMTPGAVLGLAESGIRAAGITRQKTGYCLGLAEAVENQSLVLDSLESLETDAAMKLLMQLKGIGPWTAEVYLLTALHRADIFPAKDRALVVAAKDFGLFDEEPTELELTDFAIRFSPFRSAAAWLLWHGYLAQRGRATP